MKKFQILITQYNENEEVIGSMLKSIESQQRIDLKNDIEVIIGNDGSDVKLSDEFLNSFSYPVKYLFFEHSGLPGCRKHLFEASDAEYVMFCDADDLFVDNLGIRTIFDYMNKGFDSLVSVFIEELKDINNGSKFIYIPKENDKTFVHGKVYRRQFLIDNNIVWHPELKCHEDSCFNILATTLSQNHIYCKKPFYLWKWRDDSICRKDPKYILQTYIYMIDSNDLLVRDLLMHDQNREAIKFVNSLVFNVYYLLCKKEWLDKENMNYRMVTEMRFKKYFEEHKNLFDEISPEERTELIKGIKIRNTMEKELLEPYTFNSWLEHIKNLK